MKLIDIFLNKITMYKVIQLNLILLFLIVLAFSFFDLIFYSPESLLFTLLLLVFVCFVSNYIFARIFKAPINLESSVITAFILFFIMSPISKQEETYIFIFAAILAMASKYLLAFKKKHIFNPAAFSLVVVGILGFPQISWWVGNSYLFPFVLLFGFLLIRKVRKISLFFVYFVFALISVAIFGFINSREVSQVLAEAILSYPILFLGTVMLIEPLTIPPRRKEQLVYGGLVGFLSGAQYHVGPVFSSPELAILIGNVYSYSVSFRQRLELILLDKKEIASGIYEFIFSKNNKFNFLPGQYMEWTLGGFFPDLRGSRRFFTISSSPTEDNIKIGVRIDKNGSKFKKRLLNLAKGEKIFAGSLSGDFVLSKKSEKYVFIAGGIGITPFRSIVKNAIDKNQKLDAVLLYSCSTDKEFIYKELFDLAKKVGLKTIYVCTNPTKNWNGYKGRIDKEIISCEVPDYKERTFYISGSNSMVQVFKNTLRKMDIGYTKIITDYFSGY